MIELEIFGCFSKPEFMKETGRCFSKEVMWSFNSSTEKDTKTHKHNTQKLHIWCFFFINIREKCVPQPYTL